jgi:hypothetical protein
LFCLGASFSFVLCSPCSRSDGSTVSCIKVRRGSRSARPILHSDARTTSFDLFSTTPERPLISVRKEYTNIFIMYNKYHWIEYEICFPSKLNYLMIQLFILFSIFLVKLK